MRDRTVQKRMNSMVGILTILVILWGMFYVVPEIFASLFMTFIGNLILLFTVIVIGFKDIFMAVCVAVIFAFLFKFTNYIRVMQKAHR